MEAKLIKKSENYYELYEVRTNLTLLVGSTDSERKIDVYGKDAHKLLSIKNCEAIANGYDLDKLKCDYIQEKTSDWVQQAIDENAYELEQDAKSFIKGFQKALEILGDKKFSSGQLLNAMDLVWQWMNGEDYGCKTLTEVQDKHIQSLQQTEWDCIVEMDTDCTGEFKYLLLDKGKPKLDADGCLILKRKL
jgi:hypothetical protein